MYIQNTLLWAADSIFSLILLIFTLRFIVELVRADFYNPICQWVAKVTQPLVYPLSRVIPSYKNINTGCLLLAWAISATKFLVIFLLLGNKPEVLTVLLPSLGKVIQYLINIEFVCILVVVVLSWVMPMGSYHPLVVLVKDIAAPLIKLGQRMLPPMGGLDLSPIIILFGLKFIEKLLVIPLMSGLF